MQLGCLVFGQKNPLLVLRYIVSAELYALCHTGNVDGGVPPNDSARAALSALVPLGLSPGFSYPPLLPVSAAQFVRFSKRMLFISSLAFTIFWLSDCL